MSRPRRSHWAALSRTWLGRKRHPSVPACAFVAHMTFACGVVPQSFPALTKIWVSPVQVRDVCVAVKLFFLSFPPIAKHCHARTAEHKLDIKLPEPAWGRPI